MNVAVTLAPVRVTVNVQTRGVPSVRVTPPAQLTVRAEPRITPLTVRVGGAYVLNSAPNTTTASFTHEQSTPAAVWTIPNALGAKAIVLAVYDSTGRVGIADATVTDTNTVISFSSPRTGRVDYIRG